MTLKRLRGLWIQFRSYPKGVDFEDDYRMIRSYVKEWQS